jgi:hypothetical protein
MRYISSDADRRTPGFKCTLVAAAINVTIVVAINGVGTILNTAFSSVSPLLESVCTRFC